MSAIKKKCQLITPITRKISHRQKERVKSFLMSLIRDNCSTKPIRDKRNKWKEDADSVFVPITAECHVGILNTKPNGCQDHLFASDPSQISHYFEIIEVYTI